MNIENEVRSIFNNVCSSNNNYTTYELEQIIEQVLDIEDIKDNEHALSNIEVIAKERVSGLSREQVELAKTADQKWLNMSGMAYESMILRESNRLLVNAPIRFIKPIDLKREIHNNQIFNSQKDMDTIENWIQGETFDLYLVKEKEDGLVVFGVVQCKKSIRERVSRDREPSIKATEEGFMSILIGMNGETLGKSNNTKNRQMINGNGSHYDKQGWHSAYFEILPFENGVIYKKEKLIDDLLKNYKKFKDDTECYIPE